MDEERRHERKSEPLRRARSSIDPRFPSHLISNEINDALIIGGGAMAARRYEEKGRGEQSLRCKVNQASSTLRYLTVGQPHSLPALLNGGNVVLSREKRLLDTLKVKHFTVFVHPLG